METFKETHPYNLQERIPDGTRILIVGTAPPPRFSNPNCEKVRAHRLDFKFFYGSGDNYLWKWMNEIAAEKGTPLPSDEAGPEEYSAAARSFLKAHKIWMKDVLQTYQRKPEDPCGAADTSLKPPRVEDCTNFLEVLEEHPSVEAVVFTSELAGAWTFMAMRDQELLRDYQQAFKSHKAQEKGKVENAYVDFKKEPFHAAEICGRQIIFFIAISPSQRSGSKKGVREHHKKALYKALLFPHEV